MANTLQAYGTVVGQEQVTGLSASKALASIPNNATRAVLKARTQGVYLRLRGGTATSADMLVEVGLPVEISSKLSDVRLLQAAASSTVDVWYFG
jgi:hypothetical protein